MARLIASALFMVLIYIYSQRLVLRHDLLHLFWRPILATIVMSIIVWGLRPFGMVTAVFGGIISYTLIIFAIGGLSFADKIYIEQLLGQVSNQSANK